MTSVAKFHFKTALYGLVPGGFGHYRQLREYRNPAYQHDRDKHPVRQKHNGQSGWSKSDSAISRRSYTDEAEYRIHQQQKFTEILQMYGGFSNRTIVIWRRRFYQRFKHLIPLLPRTATILCLGARQVTEVEVLHDLGFPGAYGIDLNPGPGNPHVRQGDFMHLAEATNSIDCLYTNSLDHAFDLEMFFAENVRVLKPNGYAIYDLPRYDANRSPGAFEAIGWSGEDDIPNIIDRYFGKRILTRTEPKWQWLLCAHPIKN